MVRDFKFNKEAKLYYPGVTFSLGIIKMFIWMTVKHSYAIAHSPTLSTERIILTMFDIHVHICMKVWEDGLYDLMSICTKLTA